MNALIRIEVESSSFGIVYNITKLKNNGIELMVQMTYDRWRLFFGEHGWQMRLARCLSPLLRPVGRGYIARWVPGYSHVLILENMELLSVELF